MKIFQPKKNLNHNLHNLISFTCVLFADRVTTGSGEKRQPEIRLRSQARLPVIYGSNLVLV